MMEDKKQKEFELFIGSATKEQFKELIIGIVNRDNLSKLNQLISLVSSASTS